jgi:DNA-binding HxlR family transcriptional regulator
MTGAVTSSLGDCALAGALEVVGEKWSFLILRSAFNGLRHFEEFQRELGIARNILASRLSSFVTSNILSREIVADDRRKIIYRLTAKGLALLPVIVALRQWGETWETQAFFGRVLVDARTRKPIRQVAIYSSDGRVLAAADLGWADRTEHYPVSQRLIEVAHSSPDLMEA